MMCSCRKAKARAGYMSCAACQDREARSIGRLDWADLETATARTRARVERILALRARKAGE